jgi:hypothetical protein
VQGGGPGLYALGVSIGVEELDVVCRKADTDLHA